MPSRIEGEGCEKIISAMHGNQELQMIDLSSNHIGRIGVDALQRCIPSMSNLVVLDLANNKLGDTEMKVGA